MAGKNKKSASSPKDSEKIEDIQGLFPGIQPSTSTQQQLHQFSLDKAEIVTIRNHKFKLRGLRKGALDKIISCTLERGVVREDMSHEEILKIKKKYSGIPYKVASYGILNNYFKIKFFHRIHAFFLMLTFDQAEISILVQKIMSSINIQDFFLSMILIDQSIDTMLKMTEEEVGQLYREQKSENNPE